MSRRNRLALTLAVLLALVVCAQASGGAAKAAPDFTLKLFSGKELSLADFKGRAVVLLFWTPWCPTCNRDAPVWERVYQRFKAEKVAVEFVGVGLDDTEARCRAFVERHNLTFPNGYDGKGEIARAYGRRYQPYWAVVDTKGRLVLSGFGPRSERDLIEAVREATRNP